MIGGGEGELSYVVVRSRRATADVVVERDGSVVVRAPEWAEDGLVRELVKSKRRWIHKRLGEWRELNAARVAREYRNGEAFLYLGRGYRLSLVGGHDRDLVLRNGRFELRRGLVLEGDVAAARAAFRDFYVEKGQQRLAERTRYYAPKAGVEPVSVTVRELGRRWGSCSSSNGLSFHWKCVMAPLRVVDYIVVHELCHLHHRDHTAAFWNEVDKVLPGYRERKEWLRLNGAGLDI